MLSSDEDGDFFGLMSWEAAGDWIFLQEPKWWAPGSSAPIL
jgi:hypothetical protein